MLVHRPNAMKQRDYIPGTDSGPQEVVPGTLRLAYVHVLDCLCRRLALDLFFLERLSFGWCESYTRCMLRAETHREHGLQR